MPTLAFLCYEDPGLETTLQCTMQPRKPRKIKPLGFRLRRWQLAVVILVLFFLPLQFMNLASPRAVLSASQVQLWRQEMIPASDWTSDDVEVWLQLSAEITESQLMSFRKRPFNGKDLLKLSEADLRAKINVYEKTQMYRLLRLRHDLMRKQDSVSKHLLNNVPGVPNASEIFTHMHSGDDRPRTVKLYR